MNSPILDRHPLDGPAIKFPLGESITAALAASGKYHLLVTVAAPWLIVWLKSFKPRTGHPQRNHRPLT